MARNVLVTGASNGIGRAIAARFAAEGDVVIITGRNADRLERAAAELGARGVVCDAGDPGQVAALRAALEDRIGPALDVLVNNAGGNTDFDDRGNSGDDQADGGLGSWPQAGGRTWTPTSSARSSPPTRSPTGSPPAGR